MSDKLERTVVLTAVGIGLAAIHQFAPFAWPYSLGPLWSLLTQAWFFCVDLLWVTAMAITYWRQPDGHMWKLFFAFSAVGAVSMVWVIPSSLTWTVSQLLIGIDSVVFVHLVLALPRGRLGEHYDRVLVGAAYAYVIISRIAWLVVWSPPFQKDAFTPHNPFVLLPSDQLAFIFGPAAIVALTPLLFAGVLIGLWRHWQRAGPATRRALLPIVIAAPVQLGLTIAWHIADTNPGQWGGVREALQNPLAGLAGLVFPIGFLIGIVRARLARGGVADLAVRLGRGVPLGGLRDVLAQALRDPTLQLAFPAPSANGFVDSSGQPIDLPGEQPEGRAITRIESGDETLALIAYDSELTREDPGRIDAVASVARLALENERLAAQVRAQLDEVRASRSRIVEAADTERRRIERDLHDGAQQRLVALAMRLDQARIQSTGATALIDETTAEVLAAVKEVRNLARGVHPTILTDAGLVAAVEALAERSAVPVNVDVIEERFAPEVEIAAYYVIAEALTNIGRHASATEAHVRVSASGTRVVVVVSDNGQGGADPSAGSGLRGLTDRVEAIGGHLRLTSSPGRGTIVTATLPTATESGAQ